MDHSSPSSEKWVSLKVASELTQKPERTLRHQLAQGKILGKKDGKNWILNLSSLAPQVKVLPSEIINDLPPASPKEGRPTSDLTYKYEKKGGSAASPLSFWLFRSLFEVRSELTLTTSFSGGSSIVLPRLDEALRALAAGYYEFDRAEKIALYRSARGVLSNLWLEIEFAKPITSGASLDLLMRISDLLTKEWQPGLSGTFRKLEKKKNESETSRS